MTDKTDALVALAESRHVRVLRDMLGGIPLDELHADQRRAMEAAIEALAAPAEGDGAVACPRCGAPCTTTEEGCVDPMLGDTRYTAYHYTRPSAAAVVPEGWEIVVEGDAVRVTRPGGVVSEWTSRPNTNGSGMYDLCRALAQQEPRHD